MLFQAYVNKFPQKYLRKFVHVVPNLRWGGPAPPPQLTIFAMTFEYYKKEFTREAIKSGFSDQNITDCLAYAEQLFASNVPVIYNTSHFSGLVGYKKNYLKRAALFTRFFYREFDILKKNGKKRKISEPLPSLKEIQIWILKNILYRIEVSKYAKAYIPKMSIKQNLIFHKGQQKVLALDIEDFFPSIKQEFVESLFYSFGYSKILSSLLAKLCCLAEALPQGAPTSPYLSNIYLKSADESISRFCRDKGIRYTRYSDDMTFSGDFNEIELIAYVKLVIGKLQLKINDKKTKLMTPNTRQTVTGIVVNEKLQVSFAKRNKIRQSVYYINKFGLDNHMLKVKIKKANYLAHLLGQINFILQINPTDQEFVEYKNFLQTLK